MDPIEGQNLTSEEKTELNSLIVDGLQVFNAPEGCLCSNCGLVAIFHFTNCCSHLYCGSCYLTLKREKRNCRKCRIPIGITTIEEDSIDSSISNLRVECPNKSMGCSDLVIMRRLLEHIKMCEISNSTTETSKQTIERLVQLYEVKLQKSKDSFTTELRELKKDFNAHLQETKNMFVENLSKIEELFETNNINILEKLQAIESSYIDLQKKVYLGAGKLDEDRTKQLEKTVIDPRRNSTIQNAPLKSPRRRLERILLNKIHEEANRTVGSSPEKTKAVVDAGSTTENDIVTENINRFKHTMMSFENKLESRLQSIQKQASSLDVSKLFSPPTIGAGFTFGATHTNKTTITSIELDQFSSKATETIALNSSPTNTGAILKFPTFAFPSASSATPTATIGAPPANSSGEFQFQFAPTTEAGTPSSGGTVRVKRERDADSQLSPCSSSKRVALASAGNALAPTNASPSGGDTKIILAATKDDEQSSVGANVKRENDTDSLGPSATWLLQSFVPTNPRPIWGVSIFGGSNSPVRKVAPVFSAPVAIKPPSFTVYRESSSTNTSSMFANNFANGSTQQPTTSDVRGFGSAGAQLTDNNSTSGGNSGARSSFGESGAQSVSPMCRDRGAMLGSSPALVTAGTDLLQQQQHGTKWFGQNNNSDAVPTQFGGPAIGQMHGQGVFQSSGGHQASATTDPPRGLAPDRVATSVVATADVVAKSSSSGFGHDVMSNQQRKRLRNSARMKKLKRRTYNEHRVGEELNPRIWKLESRGTFNDNLQQQPHSDSNAFNSFQNQQIHRFMTQEYDNIRREQRPEYFRPNFVPHPTYRQPHSPSIPPDYLQPHRFHNKENLRLIDGHVPFTDNDVLRTDNGAPSSNKDVPRTDRDAPCTDKDVPCTDKVETCADKDVPSPDNDAPCTDKDSPRTNKDASCIDNAPRKHFDKEDAPCTTTDVSSTDNQPPHEHHNKEDALRTDKDASQAAETSSRADEDALGVDADKEDAPHADQGPSRINEDSSRANCQPRGNFDKNTLRPDKDSPQTVEEDAPPTDRQPHEHHVKDTIGASHADGQPRRHGDEDDEPHTDTSNATENDSYVATRHDEDASRAEEDAPSPIANIKVEKGL